jgi:hypothetical protein
LANTDGHIIDMLQRAIRTKELISRASRTPRPLESHGNPLSAFRVKPIEIQLDDLHLAYFSSYTPWNQFTIHSLSAPETNLATDIRAEECMLPIEKS